MDDREAFSDLFKPVVAGARARGVADAFELLGIDAILIDSTGRVLHAGRNVHRLLAPMAKIVEGHLLGCDPAADEALQRLIAAVIGVPGQPDEADKIVIRRDGERCALRIRAIRYPVGEDARYQLLRAVLVVTAGLA